jgi:pyruvate, water dikinase
MASKLVIPFRELRNTDISVVGGKNASLGEMMYSLKGAGISIPDGFATTAEAFRFFLTENNLYGDLKEILSKLNTSNFDNLTEISAKARTLVLRAKLPQVLRDEISCSYEELCRSSDKAVSVAVRSSATAEDLPNASFAGQHDSFLHKRGIYEVLEAVHQCYASLFNARAIKYRHDNGFDHMKVYLSAGIQRMVRSDLASAGVAFTLDPESGFRDVVLVTGCWGLGENIVQGAVNPDEYLIFKPTLQVGKNALISRKIGAKAKTLTYSLTSGELINIDTPKEKQSEWTLSSDEVVLIGKWSIAIEDHYKCPMDIEWAKDGETGEFFIVQARPETVHSQHDRFIQQEYTLRNKGEVLVKGSAVGSGIASGVARLIASPKDRDRLKQGEVLVTDITNPDWDPILKKASAIVTNKGGRTSHAAIVAREVGTIAVVGSLVATDKIRDGEEVTVSCAEGETGVVYRGKLDWKVRTLDMRKIEMPRTAPMLIVADPDKAFRLSFYPNMGVGLMRLEFVINNVIRAHPMALVKFDELTDNNVRKQIEDLTIGYLDKKQFFIDKLAEAVATIAAAFYPKDVIVRMSDFKTNEYANLIGGKQFEPEEENPMIGFRGASRYYNERYKDGFALECAAMKRVRDEMGLTNVKLMIPFCRTVEEGKKVVTLMAEHGLKRGEHGLEIYVMAEIPSNVILAKEFADVFDGFSIGSNDLTQLTLGLDRDSAIISDLFSESNAAVKSMIATVIKEAKKVDKKIGLCGQAPSDSPEFARFLVECGIDSISFNPDALLKGIENINAAEKEYNNY